MNINNELIQFYIYKHLVRRKDADKILAECRRLGMSVRDYLLANEVITEVTELEALGEKDEQWKRLAYHARLCAQLAHALSLYAAEDRAVKEAVARFEKMVFELYYETYDYLDARFYTSILGSTMNVSDLDFAREVETEA